MADIDLIRKLVVKINDLTNYFDLELRNVGTRLVGPCPIHGGDNPSGFNINIDLESPYVGFWFCNTNKCHEEWGHSTIDLIRALRSTKKIETPIKDIISTLIEGVVCPNIKTKVINRENKPLMSKEMVRSRLKIPAVYYINRGFSPEILDEFSIGYCGRENSQMYGRVVFPILDKDDYLLGCAGRRTSDNYTSLNYTIPKWKYSKGFSATNYLFNYGTIEKIKPSSIILVEGQGDVVKLAMANVRNVVGLFGSNFSESQAFLIQKLGIKTLYLATDNDEAGLKCRNKIKKKMSNLFEIKDIKFDRHDPGEMTVEEIQSQIFPQIGY